AQPFNDADGAEAGADMVDGLGQHQFARLGVALLAGGDSPFCFLALVYRLDAAILEHPQHPRRGGAAKTLEGAAVILATTHGAKPCQHALTRRQSRLARAFRAHIDQRWAALALPLDRTGEGI